MQSTVLSYNILGLNKMLNVSSSPQVIIIPKLDLFYRVEKKKERKEGNDLNTIVAQIYLGSHVAFH